MKTISKKLMTILAVLAVIVIVATNSGAILPTVPTEGEPELPAITEEIDESDYGVNCDLPPYTEDPKDY